MAFTPPMPLSMLLIFKINFFSQTNNCKLLLTLSTANTLKPQNEVALQKARKYGTLESLLNSSLGVRRGQEKITSTL